MARLAAVNPTYRARMLASDRLHRAFHYLLEQAIDACESDSQWSSLIDALTIISHAKYQVNNHREPS